MVVNRGQIELRPSKTDCHLDPLVTNRRPSKQIVDRLNLTP